VVVNDRLVMVTAITLYRQKKGGSHIALIPLTVYIPAVSQSLA